MAKVAIIVNLSYHEQTSYERGAIPQAGGAARRRDLHSSCHNHVFFLRCHTVKVATIVNLPFLALQVMTGAQFRERVVRPDDEINMEEFDKIWMVHTPHIKHHTLRTTVHPTPYTLQPSPCTLHPALYTHAQ